MEQWYRFIIHRPRLVLLLILLLTGFFAFHARHIQIDSSLDSLLPDNDPERQYYNDVVRLFGSENVAVIGLLADNIYTPHTLQKIQRLTDEFRKIPEVKAAFSIANARDVIAKITSAEQELLIPTIPATVAFGVLAELALLPALLTTTPVITLWDVLYVRLGQDPHKTIPLFAGLRPFQAKLVTLMGELKSFPQGQPIVRQGDLGNEMYVVINGTAESSCTLPNNRES